MRGFWSPEATVLATLPSLRRLLSELESVSDVNSISLGSAAWQLTQEDLDTACAPCRRSIHRMWRQGNKARSIYMRWWRWKDR